MKFLLLKIYVVQNLSLGVLNCIYLAKYKFGSEWGWRNIMYCRFMNIFGGKTRSVLPMGSSQDVTCAKVRALRVVSVQQGTGGADYFASTLFPDTRVEKAAR